MSAPLKAPRSSTISVSQFRIRFEKARISSSMDQRLIMCSTPAMTLRNLAAMLKPGGRLLLINAWSPRDGSYQLCSPAWYFDFFVTNGFVECKTYTFIAAGNRANAPIGSIPRSCVRQKLAFAFRCSPAGGAFRVRLCSRKREVGRYRRSCLRHRLTIVPSENGTVTSIIPPRLCGQLGLTSRARSGNARAGRSITA